MERANNEDAQLMKHYYSTLLNARKQQWKSAFEYDFNYGKSMNFARGSGYGASRALTLPKPLGVQMPRMGSAGYRKLNAQQMKTQKTMKKVNRPMTLPTMPK